MGAPVIVLMHSPLVGPLAWRPVADELCGRGYEVIMPGLSDAFAGRPPYYQALARAVHDALRLPDPARALLVPHSGAGPLVPPTVAALGERAAGVVFVDASLPHPGASWLDSAAAELAQQLRQLSTDGLLPPWNEWFPPGTVDALLPDPDVRSRFTAELPRVPLAYFEERAPVGEHWRRLPGAYLRLSEMYEGAAEHAGRNGWPVSRFDGHHLSMLTDPYVVTDHLEALLLQVSSRCRTV